MKKKIIDWEYLIESDDDKPSPRSSTSASRTARVSAPLLSAEAMKPTKPAANTPASRSNAMNSWQNFHVEALARQEAETAHLPSDYPAPSETCAHNGSSTPPGNLHRQGSSYRPQRLDAQKKLKAKVRSRFATTAKRVAPIPKTAPALQPRPVTPSLLYATVVATPAQIWARERQITNELQRPLPVARPSTDRVATTPRITFGLATSAELATYLQGQSKPADTTSVTLPPSRALTGPIHAPRRKPFPPVTNATASFAEEAKERQLESERAGFAKMVKDFMDLSAGQRRSTPNRTQSLFGKKSNRPRSGLTKS